MIRNFIHAVIGDVAYRNPLAAGSLQVNVVDTNPIANDLATLAKRVDDLGGKRRKLSDHVLSIF